VKNWVAVDYWYGGRPVIRTFFTGRGARRWWRNNPRRGLITIEKRKP
jgi:hypothetical protein